ncbi:MAG: septation protein IspZ [Prolixibacteraceae bacterium]|jgi:isopentenyldiphosphate isomerase/intracellular septation protein A|nr:septation protein IspZ [Prolixibacteraceae bacterium]
MKRSDLLKKLLPGFIPLFVFIAADEIWGTKVGLIVALAVGSAELIYTYIKEKRFDKFVLLDTALLVALGGVSLLLHNDIFFKIKPAVVEAILCVILAISAFTRIDIVGGMSQRYMKGIEINDQVQRKFKQTIKAMFWIFSVHTLLVVYSAFFMSKEAWAFISGGLFYIIFGVYFVYELVHQRRKSMKQVIQHFEDEEWLPVVDEEGKVLGRALRSACHGGERILHPVVHLHVMNHSKHLFLQKRPETKLIQPGKWDTAVGGHIAFGEDVKTALQREAYEEIGLKDFSARPIGSYVFESEVERELVYSFISYDYKGINLHSEEVEEGRFWSKKQIEQNLGKGVFTPNFEMEYQHQLKDKLF